MSIGAKIREARVTLEYTQEALAGEIGIGRDAVVAMESGTRNVRASELWKIARLLERPMAFFLQDEVTRDLAVVARRGAAPTSDAKRAELWLRRHFDDYQQLLAVLARPLELNVSLSWSSGGKLIDQARRAAESQRKHHGLDDQPVKDLRRHLEEDVGLPVFGREVGDAAFCGILIVTPEIDAAAMLVNSSLLASRRNFSMAHEYGHLLWKLTRREATDDAFYRNPDNTEEEVFANAFAASLLAPDRALRARTDRLSLPLTDPNAVMDLAAEFGVSFQTMTYRLQNLTLLSPEEADALRNTTRPTSLLAFRWERDAFRDLSPLYWHLVLEADAREALDPPRCAEMVDMTALEFDELIDALEEEPVRGEALLQAIG